MKPTRRERNERGRETSHILLDWFTISYRQIYLGLALLVVVAIVSYVVYRQYFRQETPLEAAQATIQRADRALSNAASSIGSDEELIALLNRSRDDLARARSLFSRREYPEAREAAQASLQKSEEILTVAMTPRRSAAKITEMSGGVEVQRAGSPRWLDAGSGMELFVGDKVHCRSSGTATLRYVGEVFQTLKPNQLIQIEDLRIDPNDRTSELIFSHLEGEIETEVPAGARVEMKAGEAVARTQGPDEIQSVRPSGESGPAQISSTRGGTRVEARGGAVQLTPNTRVEVSPGGGVSALQNVLPSPELAAPLADRIFLLERTEGETIILSWKPVPGAARYLVQIAQNPSFILLVAEQELAETSVPVSSPTFGPYWWRVFSVEKDGRRSLFPERRRFQVKRKSDVPAQPPRLELKPGIPFGEKILIEGQTETGSTVFYTINGRPPAQIPVEPGGAFRIFVNFTRVGKNVIVVTAQNPYGSENSQSVEHVYQP